MSFSFFHYEASKELDYFLTKIVFMLDKKSKFYMWTNNYAKQTSYITDLSAIFNSSKSSNSMLVEFPKIMNINPQNVAEKLAFYLVWI